MQDKNKNQTSASDKPDALEEHTLESQLVWQGNFLKVYQDQVLCPDGVKAPREYLRHPGAVMIIPLLNDDEVIVERQYRYPLRRSFIEFPAGKIDPGESLIACAQRELQEETGYTAKEWTHLGGFHNAIGYCDEKIEVFIARGLTLEGAHADAGEVLEVFTAAWRQLLADVFAGELTDVKTIVGLHWLEKYFRPK